MHHYYNKHDILQKTMLLKKNATVVTQLGPLRVMTMMSVLNNPELVFLSRRQASACLSSFYMVSIELSICWSVTHT